jgi:hypothetical protein
MYESQEFALRLFLQRFGPQFFEADELADADLVSSIRIHSDGKQGLAVSAEPPTSDSQWDQLRSIYENASC